MFTSSLSWFRFQYSPGAPLRSSTQSNIACSRENDVSCLSRTHPQKHLYFKKPTITSAGMSCQAMSTSGWNVLTLVTLVFIPCLCLCVCVCVSLLATLQHSPAVAPARQSSGLVRTSPHRLHFRAIARIKKVFVCEVNHFLLPLEKCLSDIKHCSLLTPYFCLN